MKNTIPIEGCFGQRFVDLDVYAEMTYSEDYLDVVELLVWSERRKKLVKASDRLMVAFQASHWDHLVEKCEDFHRKAYDRYKDDQDDIGDKIHEERRDREMEREAEVA